MTDGRLAVVDSPASPWSSLPVIAIEHDAVPATPTAFELCFRPSASLIHVVRKFVSDFYEQLLQDSDAVSRVALSTYELLENGVKYSLDGATALSITVDRHAPRSVVVIRLQNRAAGEHIQALREVFDEMAKYPDAFTYYQVAMERSAKKKVGSGLGIARVRAEGEMHMSYSVEDDRVCIVAQTWLEGETAA